MTVVRDNEAQRCVRVQCASVSVVSSSFADLLIADWTISVPLFTRVPHLIIIQHLAFPCAVGMDHSQFGSSQGPVLLWLLAKPVALYLKARPAPSSPFFPPKDHKVTTSGDSKAKAQAHTGSAQRKKKKPPQRSSS